MADSVVSLANKRVPIALACRLIGMDVPEVIDQGKSIKVHCPFGEFYHEDFGSEPAFRIYPDPNNAWCFACGEFFSVVSLCAKAWDIAPEQTAVQLLDRIGYKPATYAQHWKNAAAPDFPDGSSLTRALQFYCARIQPGWTTVQHHPVVAEYLAKCLGLIQEVATAEEADAWLDGTKQVMQEIMGRMFHAEADAATSGSGVPGRVDDAAGGG